MTSSDSLLAAAVPAAHRCIVCGSAAATAVFHEFGVDVLECGECGHVYSSWTGGQDYDGYFGADSIDPAGQGYWNEQHARMYDAFTRQYLSGRQGRLLDVGCGLGYFVARVAAIPGWEAYGYEISPAAVAYARTHLGLTTVFCGRVEASTLPPASFDVITLWDVIEHIPDPDPLLSYLRTLLTDDGVLCMHTPNAAIQVPKAKLKRRLRGVRAGGHYLEARDHVNLYKMSTLRRVLARNGFRHVRYFHLPPIDSIGLNSGVAARLGKRAWFGAAAAVFRASGGRINLDNLFVDARR
jgi:2-polyprenyl-3-methyl-5-hydroxy-6-metoxy-1,4-benzoquinol methylase